MILALNTTNGTFFIPCCDHWCYGYATPNGVVRARRHGSRYRYGSPTGMRAGSFAGTVATDMGFPTGMTMGSSRHSHEPRQGFNVCSPVRFPTMFRRTP